MKNLMKLAAAIAMCGIFGFLAYGLSKTLETKHIDSSDTAGWVQAIGAVIGIAIAIWVPYKQRHDEELAAEFQRRDSERKVCLAFRDELAVLASRFEGANVQALLGTRSGIFDREIPIPRRRFPVFDAMIGRLTEIEDERIRRGIIETYDVANTLTDLAGLNNKHLNELALMLREPLAQGFEHAAIGVERKQAILASIREQMQVVCRTTIVKVGELLPMLNSAIEMDA